TRLSVILFNKKKPKSVLRVTLSVSRLSDANAINVLGRIDTEYIEYFIAANCYVPPFRIR
ncbi:hypothetical protein, partial [Enterobacter cloacae]|uniref:hypothetical protein n=1 Tax=Enterobacter cloacae TaxID=550 RepID=UPI0019D6B1DD